MDIQAREFSIALAQLMSRAIEGGLPPDVALAVLQDKIQEELRLQRSRQAVEKSY